MIIRKNIKEEHRKLEVVGNSFLSCVLFFSWTALPAIRYIFFRTMTATLLKVRAKTVSEYVLLLGSYILALKKDTASIRAALRAKVNIHKAGYSF